MQTMLNNYINGNISTARRQAKRYSTMAIIISLENDYGYSEEKAIKTALHIKTGEGWQAACDAK